MKADKVERFMRLAGQQVAERMQYADAQTRELGAQLLLSEVLEYVIHGLGVDVTVGEERIQDPNALFYQARSKSSCDAKEMLDGLCDVAYTMYWNALAFGIPLEEGYELVCDNNLEKFVRLEQWAGERGALEQAEWHCGQDVCWPEAVSSVTVVEVKGICYAVGKDSNGKVRKPSHYRSVDLSPLLSEVRS